MDSRACSDELAGLSTERSNTIGWLDENTFQHEQIMNQAALRRRVTALAAERGFGKRRANPAASRFAYSP